jgi:hypothetical protein
MLIVMIYLDYKSMWRQLVNQITNNKVNHFKLVYDPIRICIRRYRSGCCLGDTSGFVIYVVYLFHFVLWQDSTIINTLLGFDDPYSY